MLCSEMGPLQVMIEVSPLSECGGGDEQTPCQYIYVGAPSTPCECQSDISE